MQHEKVLARGSGGRPYVLVLVSRTNKLCYLANSNLLDRVRAGLSEPVGVPSEDVFPYNKEAADRLAALWSARGFISLEEWNIVLDATQSGANQAA